MSREYIHSLIHRATVTASEKTFVDAVQVDSEVLDAADLRVGERVVLTNVTDGRQLETYVLPAPAGSGAVVGLGAAARLASRGAEIVLTSYIRLGEEEARTHTPHMVMLTEDNHVHGAGGPVPAETAALPSLVPGLEAPWALRVSDAGAADAHTLAQWMNSPHIAHAWGRAWPTQVWRQELRRQLALGVSWPCFVSHRNSTLGYLEIYRVADDPLSRHIGARPEDVGLHIALANPEARGHGHGPALLAAVSDALLREGPPERRVLAEPNATNAMALRAFEKAGFTRHATVPLPQKTAALMVKETAGNH
ncbi:aspartate 1-decarboxylase [Streptomyces sp. NPDC088785]|uniref:aspartate 1-decarboxylase n=1 Tax=Streptomyces sp. NPDC088785 TaxID=3365897 RepID=UPI0037F3B728